MLPLGALAVIGLALPALSQSSAARTFEQRDGAWYRLEQGRAYLVHDGEVTVKFAAPVTDLGSFRAALGTAAAPFAGLSSLRSNRLGIHDLALPAGSDPLELVARLRATGLVEFAEEVTYGHFDGTPPNDPMFDQLWHLENIGQSGGTPGADVDALAAWSIEDGEPSIVVAVIDSGTEWFHPDLAQAMWTNPGEIPNNDQDDDGNGFVDDTLGWDFQYNTKDPSSNFYHGTAVASVVGAVGNNGVGLVGLAGGPEDGAGVSIMALQIGDSSGPISSVIDDAILYALDNGADVITLSLDIPSDTAITAAINAAYSAGVFINCAAGNFFAVKFPANLPNVVAVGGTDNQDAWAGFSSGPQVFVSAPSVNITMCDLGGGYTVASGTSFGSQMVAALAALVLSINPSLSPAAVAEVIRANADDVGAPGYDIQTGHGRINAAQTLAAVDTSVVIHGSGTVDGVGNVPKIGWKGGGASVGNALFEMTLAGVQPGSVAVLVIGLGSTPASTPFAGGTLYVNLGLPVLTIVQVANLDGYTGFPLPLPNDPSLQGANLTSQWVVIDAVVQYALSAALAVTIDV